ncbi:phenylacetic acid degradation operon negative regulatory protein PaaX [Noviherbaspirillum saxi]|uniref:Phenylacetic acid degradation operon negative regulatory protein PaaX n=1 Tax=Noviherbaspirillum saxi TaxID=2320863 RepID=A0A3A3FRI1_9BURK|nr:phenylacetic acid degradation operon negative regulatory protein PaaX [Noviherbaspirillum saxi]RJF96349.1 phenylacetic acid degradation operon negative regulatory protein PaaX [Noviherbaspirillum saxi]
MLDNPPRAKSMVMTLFGDVITPHGGQVWLGSLIELLTPFGISDRLVRTSVFRLAEEGWLEAKRAGRRSQYALKASAARRFERAYQRVYTPTYRAWDGKWTLLFATSGAITADQRAALRKELLWEGFGTLSPSVFGHPSADAETVKEILDRVGADGNVVVCHAVEADMPAARPLSDLVGECWGLESIVASYEHFIDCFDSVPELLGSGHVLKPEHAFVVRTLLIHEFRRVQLHDPQLPLELLPENWPGKTAHELCHRIYEVTHAQAEQFITETLRREDEEAPEAAPYFYQRFGGLGDLAQ